MYVNTGGGGKTQQQQPLQNQNQSVRHNNPYPHTQQPHYEHHQGSVTFVTYPFCNVAPGTHATPTGGGNGVGSGQAGHVLYQATHQPPPQQQQQQHPTQQHVGLHNTEQTLHYFTKGAPMPTHHLYHPSQQQHSQIRNMISAVSHQRQPFVVAPNYFALSHAILPQQTRASLLTNTAPQHAVAAANASSIATQLQNNASRNVGPSGPAYCAPPYCRPPIMLSTPTTATPQPPSILSAAPGMGKNPNIQAYTHMGGGMPSVSAPAAPINMTPVVVSVPFSSSSNTEHPTKIKIKRKKHPIPIIHPDTLEIVTLENLVGTSTQPQAKHEINIKSASIQTDKDNSLTNSVVSEPLDVLIPTPSSNSICETEGTKMIINDHQMPTDEVDCKDDVKEIDCLPMDPTTFSVPVENTITQSLNSCSNSDKICAYDDANDTDADTNEHELDNEDDVLDRTDGNLAVIAIDPELPANHSREQEPKEIIVIDPISHVIPQTVESDSEHSTETEVKSKDEPCPISVKNSLDRKAEVNFNENEQDVKTSVCTVAANESKKKRKNKKGGKSKEKPKKQNKQSIKGNNNTFKQNEEQCTSNPITNLKATETDKQKQESKKESIEEPKKNTFIRYTLEELKSFAKSPESRKTPVVPCQKGDCISQLFVACQQHHLHHHSMHQGEQNINAHNVQQSYHHMNFNESIEFVTGKRRVGGSGNTVGASRGIARKHDFHNNAGSTGNININSLSAANNVQMQKKMPVIRINLSLNEEIQLSESKNAWQPKFLNNNSNNNSPTADKDNANIEDVLKKVRGILNKLTMDNFDILLKEMTSITINSKEAMEKIMLLIFEKTVSEPNFAPTYAKFSKVLFEEVKTENKKIFNALLISRLQTEFESNVNNADAKERTLQQITNKLNETTDQQEKIELQSELEHQEYQFRRRAWGTVRFIGEMYKLQSLTTTQVVKCIESLLDHGNEEKLEYMCKLLTTVGNLLESSSSELPNTKQKINKVFARIQNIVKEAKESSKKKIKICSRVRFMMQDLIDLRSRNWDQLPYPHSSHAALRRRQPEDRNSNVSSASLNTHDRGYNNRTLFGNNRQNQTRTKDSGNGNYFVQKPPKSQYLGQREHHSIDLKKLNFSRRDESSQETELGNKSIYMWRIVAGRQTSPMRDLQQSDRTSPLSVQLNISQQSQNWGNKNQNLDLDVKAISDNSKHIQRLLNHLLEEYLDCLPSRSNRWQEEVINIWQKTDNDQQISLVYYILTDYLHLAAVKRLERNACANIFIYLMLRKELKKSTFSKAYEQFAHQFPDLLVDVPNGWTYVFEFMGSILHEGLLEFSDIWHDSWSSDKLFTERFVNALVFYFTKYFGANYMRDLWHNKFKLGRGQLFISDQQQWRQFVAANKLQFLYDSKVKPEIVSTNANITNNTNSNATIMDQHVQRLEILLSSPNDSNLALDYINTNVNINNYFLRNLTRLLCCDYPAIITMKAATFRTGSRTTSKNSSTCSNSSSSSDIGNFMDNSNNAKKPQLNVNEFRKNCLPLLRLCIDAHEDHELTCLDSVVNTLQEQYDTNTANELICSIFDILYDCEVIAKETFEKWYKQQQIKRPLSAHLEAYLQKLL